MWEHWRIIENIHFILLSEIVNPIRLSLIETLGNSWGTCSSGGSLKYSCVLTVSSKIFGKWILFANFTLVNSVYVIIYKALLGNISMYMFILTFNHLIKPFIVNILYSIVWMSIKSECRCKITTTWQNCLFCTFTHISALLGKLIPFQENNDIANLKMAYLEHCLE